MRKIKTSRFCQLLVSSWLVQAAAWWGPVPGNKWQGRVHHHTAPLHHSLLPSSSRAASFCHTVAHNHSLFPKFSKFTFEWLTMLPEPDLYLPHDNKISDACENTPPLSAFCARAAECLGHVAECVMTMEIVYSLQAPDNVGTRGGVWRLWSKGQRNSRWFHKIQISLVCKCFLQI